jgi:ATP-dependent Clp protease ATP-binding subunit ClpA
MTEALSDPQPTPRYQAILAAASRRAVDLGHDYVGTEHLLLALLADMDAVATQVLGRFAPAAEITDELQAVMASGSYNTPGKPRAEPGLTS